MASANQDDILGLLWNRPTEPPAPARPSLNLVAIIDSALAIADAEGLESVSMQRVAAGLGFTKMSLYRYVSTKADLISLMIETAVGDPPDLSRVRGDWRAKLTEFTGLLADVWKRHPWLPWATTGDRVMGPREVGWVEAAVSALDGTGLPGGDRLDGVYLLFGHMRNTEPAATAGTQPWTPNRRRSDGFVRILDRHGTAFPALTAAIGDVAGSPADNGRGFGIACILDGIAARIPPARPDSA